MISTVNRALLNSRLDSATILSGGQIIVVVLAGLLFGLAFQLLLANFGIAIGLSIFNLKPNPPTSDKPPEPEDASFGSVALIGVAAGLAIMLSIDGVLFAACYLAVKLSQVSDPWLGAILGGLVWAVYLILLTWLSTSAVGTIADTVLGFTRAGLRRLFAAVGQLFNPTSSDTSSADEDPDVIGHSKLIQALEDMDFSPVFESTLAKLKSETPSKATHLSQIAEEVIANTTENHTIDLGQIVEELQNRLNLPQPILEELQQQLQKLTQEVGNDPHPVPEHPQQSAPVTDLKNFLQTADPSDLQSESLSTQLAPLETSHSWSTLQDIDFKGLLRTALRRVDLSDWDVQRIWQVLQSTQQKLTGSSESKQPINIIQLDVEDYLLNTPPWNLQPDIIEVDFKDILYDPAADPSLVHQQLILLTPDQIQEFLQQRQDLPDHQLAKIANVLNRVRLNILDQVQPSSDLKPPEREHLHQIQQKLESYCRYTTLSKLSPEGIEQKLKSLIEEIPIPTPMLASYPPDLDALQKILKRRKGLQPKKRKALLAAISENWQHLLPDSIQPAPPSIHKRLKTIIAEQLQGPDVQSITLEDLKPQLMQLIDQPTSGLTVFNQYLGQLDWMSLAQELQDEYDLTPQNLNSILATLQEEWQQIAKFPRRWARRTQRTAQDWQGQLQRYLKYQDRAALTKIESIEQDLKCLLEEVNMGSSSPNPFPQLPCQSEIIALLQERKDLTAAEMEQISLQLALTWEKLGEEAQSLQKQAQSSLDTVATKVREILSSLPYAGSIQLQETLSDALPHIEVSQIGDSLQDFARKAPTELLTESSWQQIRDRISVLTQSTYQQIIHTRDDLEDTVKHQLSEQAEALQQQLLDQVDQLQTELQQQARELKQDTQRQADKVRQSAAIAAWWLFAIALTSGITSALSGYWAVRGFR
ncbi:hypothetical protein AM1_5001 [Acaryochloris marina MBIC11017]|uniref:Uncharacterized protein n=2 Tax=Acaryochloris marina TaxID=155978 RepID=B0C5V7_ACAM1|nr:hypothetical protein AM1_5001 [Acaryochloris marina MBIC11017]